MIKPWITPYATWGVENAPPKFVPSEFELTAIRAQVQT